MRTSRWSASRPRSTGSQKAPYPTKAETDASYKRLVDYALDPGRLAAVRIGIASHNLFDVAWAHLLARERGVADRVELEMLKGMAPGVARAVRDAVGGMLLYTPVVEAADFSSALAYLFRRFEENAGGENFLRHLFDLARDPAAFETERARFATAVAQRFSVSDGAAPARRPRARADGFANVPDTDPTDPAALAAIRAALAGPPAPALPPVRDAAEVDRVVAAARAGAESWRMRRPPRERAALLRRAADELEAARPALIALMADEAAKTVAEGDREVSEAVDYARYYAECALELERRAGGVRAARRRRRRARRGTSRWRFRPAASSPRSPRGTPWC